MATDDKLNETLRMLVTANHILHYHAAVDGFGHISVRHPHDPSIYIMSGYMAPALVEDHGDLIQYHVNDSAPVDPEAKKGYSERFIHGEIFKRYPDVQSVVHSHAEAVLPYVSSNVPLKPMFHMGGFLGGDVPVWDIVPVYDDDSYQQDMLVNNQRLGASLANKFSPSSGNNTTPERTVVLMRRHGYTTHGKDIPTAVYRTLYTLINAGVQTKAMGVQSAAKAAGLVQTAEVTGLSRRHAQDCQKMNEATQDKSWALWEREVAASPLYRNKI